MEEVFRQNVPHPVWIVYGTVDGKRKHREFPTHEQALNFMNQLPVYHAPISVYKVDLVAERAANPEYAEVVR